MLTVVEYQGKLFYVIGSSKSRTDGNYFVGLRVDTGTFETLYINDCEFRYFIDDKGYKYDGFLKRIRENKKKN